MNKLTYRGRFLIPSDIARYGDYDDEPDSDERREANRAANGASGRHLLAHGVSPQVIEAFNQFLTKQGADTTDGFAKLGPDSLFCKFRSREFIFHEYRPGDESRNGNQPITAALAGVWNRLSPDIQERLATTHPELARLPRNSAIDGQPPLIDIDTLPNIEDLSEPVSTFLLDGILEENTVTVFTGRPGDGKSLLAAGIGAAISQGKDFAGLETTRAHVLYVDRERQKLDHFRKRLKMMSAATGPTFKIWGRWISQGAPPLATSPSLLAWVKKHPRCLIIVDSQIAFLDGREESSATDMRAFYDEWGQLSNYGATILILHHVGKADGSVSRGSGDIEAQDSLYLVERMNNGVKLEKLRLTWQKSRALLTYQLNLRFDDDGRGWTIDTDAQPAAAQRGQDREQQAAKLIALLKAKQSDRGITLYAFGKLAAKKKVAARDTAIRFLKEGVRDGTIKQTTGLKNAMLHTWAGGSKGDAK
jgi:hypothetical protein